MSPDPGSSPRAEARHRRDAALARVGRVRGLAIAGSAALSGAFAALVAASPPGSAHTVRATGGRASASGVSGGVSGGVRAPDLPPLASAAQLGLGPPGEGPGSGGGDTAPGAGAAGGGGSGSSGATGGGTGAAGAQTPAPTQPPVVSGGS
jgi:hypothetical protein